MSLPIGARLFRTRVKLVAEMDGRDQPPDRSGTIDPALFYESTDTVLSDQCISGVFPEADVQTIIDVVNDLRRKVVAGTDATLQRRSLFDSVHSRQVDS